MLVEFNSTSYMNDVLFKKYVRTFLIPVLGGHPTLLPSTLWALIKPLLFLIIFAKMISQLLLSSPKNYLASDTSPLHPDARDVAFAFPAPRVP